MTHDEIQELLGAYALDALEPAEVEVVDDHLRDCPRCRAEVRDHRETASLLAFAGSPAPPEVWDRIAAELDGSPPRLTLAADLGLGRDRGSPADLRGRRRRRSGSGLLLAAAAVVISVVALGVSVTGRGSSGGGVAAGSDDAKVRELAAAAVDPSSLHVHLASADASAAAEVIVRHGEAWLAGSTLPVLGHDRTYQLWGVRGGAKVSLAVLGSDPSIVRFPVGADYEAMAITAEQAPGVVASVNAPVVVGSVPAHPPS